MSGYFDMGNSVTVTLKQKTVKNTVNLEHKS